MLTGVLTTSGWNRLRILGAFIRKDSHVAVTYKLQLFFQLSQVFVSIATLFFLGQYVNNSSSGGILRDYGGDYFSFALVGVAITSYSRAGLVSISEEIRQTMTQGTLEALCATPVSYTWLLVCTSSWSFLFETIRIMLYFLLGVAVFGLRVLHANWYGVVLTLMLTMVLFLLFGIMSCSILILVKRGDPINWILANISGLLAGTMFPVCVLPKWLQGVSFCLPLTHALDAMRKFALMGSSIGEVWRNLVVLLAFILVLLPLAIGINKICMRKAKEAGSFSSH